MRFVADQTVGKAAKWLRLLGFDVIWMRAPDDEFLATCLSEGRVLLTRDKRLAARRNVSPVFLLGSDHHVEQVARVLNRFRLRETVAEILQGHKTPAGHPGPDHDGPVPFSRCVECNERLLPVRREDIVLAVPDFTWATQTRFEQCGLCGRVYWAGTHQEHMLATFQAILQKAFELEAADTGARQRDEPGRLAGS